MGAELAVRDQRAQRLDDNAHAQQRRNVGRVIRRRDLDNFEPADALRDHKPEELQRFTRQKAAGLGPTGAGHEPAIDRVDIERDVDRVGVLPGELERDLGRSFPVPASRCRRWSARWSRAFSPPARRRAAPANRRCRAGRDSMPTRSEDLSPSTRGGVHPFVEVFLLNIDVAVEVDDADPLRRALCDAPHAGKADRMVAAQHHRQRAGGEDMRDAAGNLVEALLQIGGNGEHVAGVAQCHLLAQIDAELVIVRIVERRDTPDALRPEARAGTVGRAGIERNTYHGGVVSADVADVLDVGRLEKRIDAGEVWQLAARESRDGLVGQAVRPGQTHVERPLLLLAPPLPGQPALRFQRFPALRGKPVEVGMMAAQARSGPEESRPCARGASVDWDSCIGSLGLARVRADIERLREAEHGDGAVALQVEIVSDDGAEPSRCLRVEARTVEGDQTRAERKGFLQIMRHHEDGHAALAPERADERVHLGARAGIEGAERLVEQQHPRFARQRLRDGEALLHAARERARILVAMCVQSHGGEQSFASCDRPRAAPGRSGAPGSGSRRIRIRSGRCRARSGAETPNSAGTRRRGRAPAPPASARRRGRAFRGSAAPVRGPCARTCSCRIPRGRQSRRRRRTRSRD